MPIAPRSRATGTGCNPHLQQTLAPGHRDGLQLALHAQLAQDPVYPRLEAAEGDVQLGGDLGAGSAIGEESQDLDLPGGEGLQPAPALLRLLAAARQVVDQRGQLLAVHEGLAGGATPDPLHDLGEADALGEEPDGAGLEGRLDVFWGVDPRKGEHA